MSKEKQIEETTAIIAECGISIYHGDVCTREEKVSDALASCISQVLFDNNYRKADEVAREIFEEIKKQLVEYFDGKDKEYTTMRIKSTKQLQIATAHYQGATNAIVFATNVIAELKKKYTEGKGEI